MNGLKACSTQVGEVQEGEWLGLTPPGGRRVKREELRYNVPMISVSRCSEKLMAES